MIEALSPKDQRQRKFKNFGKVVFYQFIIMRFAAFFVVCVASSFGVTASLFTQDGFTPPVYNATVVDAFASKILLNPFSPSDIDPYNVTDFNTTWVDHVCAVRYEEGSNRKRYYLQTYESPAAANSDGAFVTHLHPCGFCSSTQDLSVYMNISDLTNPVRDCALMTFLSMDAAHTCLMKIGFSSPCALIWLQDAMNTRKECLGVCLTAWIEHTPNNVPANSTNLNPCIACDEDKSGPIFKIVAGRTRRDSGLKSNINRPADSIYPLYHYYY